MREPRVSKLMERVVRAIGLDRRAFEEFGGSAVRQPCPACGRAEVIVGQRSNWATV